VLKPAVMPGASWHAAHHARLAPWRHCPHTQCAQPVPLHCLKLQAADPARKAFVQEDTAACPL
jgi:hypothetical protein